LPDRPTPGPSRVAHAPNVSGSETRGRIGSAKSKVTSLVWDQQAEKQRPGAAGFSRTTTNRQEVSEVCWIYFLQNFGLFVYWIIV
jgi:hypothetical protein